MAAAVIFNIILKFVVQYNLNKIFLYQIKINDQNLTIIRGVIIFFVKPFFIVEIV